MRNANVFPEPVFAAPNISLKTKRKSLQFEFGGIEKGSNYRDF